MANKSAHRRSLFCTSDFVLIIALSATLSIDQIYPTAIPISVHFRLAIGLTLLCVAWIILGQAKLQFKKFAQPSKPGRTTTQLVTQGIFKKHRNPMYSAVVLIAFSLGLLFNSLWVSVVSPVSIFLLLHFYFILPEEKYLEDVFSDEYSTYKSFSRRWL